MSKRTMFNRMDYLTDVYHQYDGNIHYIMNNLDLDDQDYEYLVDYKAYTNGFKKDIKFT